MTVKERILPWRLGHLPGYPKGFFEVPLGSKNYKVSRHGNPLNASEVGPTGLVFRRGDTQHWTMRVSGFVWFVTLNAGSSHEEAARKSGYSFSHR